MEAIEVTAGIPGELLVEGEPAEVRPEPGAWPPIPLMLGLSVGMPSPAIAGGLLVPAHACHIMKSLIAHFQFSPSG